MRRFLKLAAIAIPALALAGAVALLVYLQSAGFQEFLRARVIQELEQRFAVRAELEAIRIDWVRTAVRLEGLRLHDIQYPMSEPAIELPAAVVDFSLTDFLSPKATLDDLELRGLVVRVLADPNGRLNLVNMFRKPGGPPPDLSKLIQLGIRRWRLESGLLIFNNQPIRLESSRGGMDLEVQFFPERRRYAGILKLAEVDFAAGPVALSPLDLDIKFELSDNSIDFPSLEATTPALRLQQRGAIVDLTHFTYRFEGEMTAEPARFQKPDLASEIRSGEFLARGAFSGTGGNFRYQGRLESEAFQWREFGFRDFSADVRLDRTSVVAEDIRFLFEGGRVAGNGELGWDDAVRSHFQMDGAGFSLARLAPWLQSPELQVRGGARATVEVAWPGLEFSQIAGAGNAAFEGDFVLPQPPLSPRAFPFTGRTPFEVGRFGVRFDQGQLETLESTVGFSGAVDPDAHFRVNAEVMAEAGQALVDFAAISPIWPDWWDEWPIPGVDAVLAQVILEGERGRIDIEGSARLRQVKLAQQAMGDLDTEFRFAPEEVALQNFQLNGESHRIQGSLEVALADDGARLESMRLDAAGVPIQEWLNLIGVDSPLQGLFTGDVTVDERAPGDYEGKGKFHLADARLLQQQLERLEGDYVIDGQHLRLSSLRGQVMQGQIEGQLLYRFLEKSFEITVRGSQLELGRFAYWPEDLSVSGTAVLSAEVAGDFDHYRLNATLEAPSLQLAGYTLDGLNLEAIRRQPQDPSVAVKAAARFMGNPFLASGNVGLEPPYAFEADLDVADLPLGPYLGLLPAETRIDLEGEVTGKAHLSGNASDPASLRAEADFSRVQLAAEGYEIRNQTPLSIRFADRMVKLQPVRFTGRDTELQLSGDLDFRREPSVTFKTDGTLNLLILNPFLGGGSTLGTVQLETVLSGPLESPRLVGDARVENAFLQHPSLPTPLFDTSGRLRFTADQISIDQLSARTIYGVLNAQGGVFLEGLEPVRWLVNVYGSGLRLEFPEKVFSTLDLDVDLLRNDDSQLLSGVVYLRSTEYNEEISLPELLLRYTATPTFTPTMPAEDLVLDIDVSGYRTLQIDNNLADVTGSGDFKIRGTLGNPVVLGSLTVDEGKLFIENNEYEITRGSINFNNPRQTRPVFNFEAQTDVRDVSVNILVTGPVDQLKVSFRSDPPLPTSSIISLLAVGQTQEELFGPEGGQEQVGSLAIFGAGALLSKSLGQKLQEQSSRLFGFDRVSIDPFLFGSERNPGARVTLGKQLGNRLSVTYSTDLGNQTQGQIVVVELRITDWLTAVGTGEQDGTLAIDFKLKKRF